MTYKKFIVSFLANLIDYACFTIVKYLIIFDDLYTVTRHINDRPYLQVSYMIYPLLVFIVSILFRRLPSLGIGELIMRIKTEYSYNWKDVLIWIAATLFICNIIDMIILSKLLLKIILCIPLLRLTRTSAHTGTSFGTALIIFLKKKKGVGIIHETE